MLLVAGEVCKALYFINIGCLRFYSQTVEGKEMTRYFAFENKFGTDMSSFISLSPSFESIEVLEDTELLMISRTDFFNLVETVPQVNFIYRDMLEMAYVTTQRRIYGFQGDTALDRLKWLMQYQPKVLSRLSSRVIATYLGVTPYTLSRLKAEL